jgi:2-methylisocitrate lyase-like PEP mutase family enzyme
MAPMQSILGRTFLDLHRTPSGFIMPNAWDAGSAIILAAEGFPAIATTSAGIAFSLGRPDYRVGNATLAVSRTEMLAAIEAIVSAVAIPVNADLEAGYGDVPDEVAETVRLAIAAGAAGGNIEDTRTTDGVFTPGAIDLTTVRTLVKEIDGPLNLVIGLDEAASSAFDLLAAGAKRISVGGSIARSALGLVRRAARELKSAGTVSYAREQIPQSELNALFARAGTSA